MGKVYTDQRQTTHAVPLRLDRSIADINFATHYEHWVEHGDARTQDLSHSPWNFEDKLYPQKAN